MGGSGSSLTPSVLYPAPGDGVITGLDPEAARAPALGVTIPAGREQAAELCGDSGTGVVRVAGVVQVVRPGMRRVAWLPVRMGHGQEPGGLQPPQHVYGRSGCPGLSPCLSSGPSPKPSGGRAGCGGAALAWGVGRIWGSCSPVPLWGWGAVTHYPSRRIQGAGVSPCLEPEVPCAHLPPDVTNATMGTGSE